MRTLSRTILLGAAIATLLFAVSAAPASARTFCGDLKPVRQSDAGFFNIATTRIGCRSARITLKRWYNASYQPRSGPVGWTCKTIRSGPGPTRFRCARGSAAIYFTAY